MNRHEPKLAPAALTSNAPVQKGRLTVDYLNNHVGYSETKVANR